MPYSGSKHYSSRKRSKHKAPPSGIWDLVRRFWWIGALLAVVVFFWVRWILTAEEMPAEYEAVCVIVVDRTISTEATPLTTESLERLASDSIDGCAREKAKTTIYYFDQQSPKLVRAHDRLAYELYLPAGKSQASRETERDRQVEEAKEVIVSLFQMETGDLRGSDVLTAYREAAQNLQDQAYADGKSETYLVMITDGQQTAIDISLAVVDSPTFDVAVLVEEAVELELVPNLARVQVTFAGPGGGIADGGGNLQEWQEAKFREFWQDVTTRGGGALCAYGPTPQVIPVSCSVEGGNGA